MMILFRIFVQWSVEPLIAHPVCNSQHAWAITSVLLLNYIFLLTGLRIYTSEYKAQGPTLCPTEG